MNTEVVIDALVNKQYNAAEEGIAAILKAKISDASIEKKEFFDYVDKNYKSDVEKATGKEDPDADDEEKVAREKSKKEDK